MTDKPTIASQQPTQPQFDHTLFWYDCYASLSNAADTSEHGTTELLHNNQAEDECWHNSHLEVYTTIMAQRVAHYATTDDDQAYANHLYANNLVPAHPWDGESQQTPSSSRCEGKKRSSSPTASTNPTSEDQDEEACSTVTDFGNGEHFYDVFNEEELEERNENDLGVEYERWAQRGPERGSSFWKHFDHMPMLDFLESVQENDRCAMCGGMLVEESRPETLVSNESGPAEKLVIVTSNVLEERHSKEPEKLGLDDEECEFTPNTPVSETERNTTHDTWNLAMNREYDRHPAARAYHAAAKSPEERILKRLQEIREALERIRCVDSRSPAAKLKSAGLSASFTSAKIVEALLPNHPKPV